MSLDHYDLLDIPENANDIWIRRAYDLKTKALDSDPSLDVDEKQMKRILIDKAFNVLSNPDARARYDLRGAGTPIQQRTRRSSAPLWMALVGVIVVVASSAIYWQNLKIQESRRIDQQKLIAEQAAKDSAAAELLRIEQAAAKRKEMQEAQEALNQKVYEDQLNKRYVGEASDAEKARAASEKRLVEARARQEQSEQLREQSRAESDLRRQKQFVQQAERERQYASEMQRQQAQQELYRQQYEERRNREPIPPR